jgi:hypothetical protein
MFPDRHANPNPEFEDWPGSDVGLFRLLAMTLAEKISEKVSNAKSAT